MAKHYLAPFENQDFIEEGLVRTVKGRYFDIYNCHISIDGLEQNISPETQQDKLAEGLIKIGKEYVVFDDIDQIVTEHIIRKGLALLIQKCLSPRK